MSNTYRPAPGPCEVPQIVHIASSLAIVVGSLVSLGWAFDIERLKALVPGLVSMKTNAAVAFILLGVAIRLLAPEVRSTWRTAFGCLTALVTLVIAAVTLSEYVFDWSLGLDELMFKDVSMPGFPPGRMAPAAAISLLALSSALILAIRPARWSRLLAQALILISLIVTGLAVVGYIYEVQALYRFRPLSSVAVHAATVLLVCSIGVLHLRPNFEIMAPLRSQGVGGAFARRALPFMVGLPIVLGWLRLQGARHELFTIEFGVAAHTVATIVVFVIIVWRSARSLDHADECHQQTRKEASDLRRLSHLDPLTGVYNRRSLHERLDREWSRAIRHELPLSCLMIDIDHFKHVNDTYGHQAGDAVLRNVASMLVKQCRPGDLVCRYGGEEFCIIAPQTAEQGAFELSERLRNKFASALVPCDGHVITITTSIGVAESWGWTDDADAMVRRADKALLVAKEHGRNRVVRASAMTEQEERGITASLAI